ncbi:hypothetical protein BDQ17DRAFT_989715 [Cyathus striatus]|nr:hypothetical protein BDQ17DRAFT_989715 [Cyathus striatus]
MSDKLPLKQHLGTNYVPSTEDLAAIKNFLEASDKEMYDIDVEMDQLQQRLKLLQEKRSKVNDVVERYDALTSPARRLGPDILEEIFLACLPTNHNPCIIATEAPVLLTHICSSWRSIAHSTPRLWSSIHIVLPNLRLARDPPAHTIPFMECLGHKKLTQRYEAAIDWLNRSGACPLNISVYQSTGYNIGVNFPGVDRYAHISEKEKQLHIAFIIDVLISHSQRWHEIDVCLSWQVLEAILAVRNIPVLKKLHITDQRLASISELDSSGPGWNSLIELLKVSRGLTSLSFCGFVVRSTDIAQMPQVVSEQLTELTLDAYPGTSTLLSASHHAL